MKQPKEVIAEWIERINDEGRGLTGWEKGFIEDLTDRLERSGSLNLTDGQEEILERIYTDRTP